MRQQHNESREQSPFVLARADELVYYYLSAIGEVAKLSLPEHQRFGIVTAVAVLKTEHTGFGKRGVVNFETGLVRGDVGQRDVLAFVLYVHQRGVSLVERAALAVLTAE